RKRLRLGDLRHPVDRAQHAVRRDVGADDRAERARYDAIGGQLAGGENLCAHVEVAVVVPYEALARLAQALDRQLLDLRRVDGTLPETPLNHHRGPPEKPTGCAEPRGDCG